MAAETMNCVGNTVFLQIIFAKTEYLFILNFLGLEKNMHKNFILHYLETKLKQNKRNTFVYMHVKCFWMRIIFPDFIMNVLGGLFFWPTLYVFADV